MVRTQFVGTQEMKIVRQQCGYESCPLCLPRLVPDEARSRQGPIADSTANNARSG
jgi:hypothetical protein